MVSRDDWALSVLTGLVSRGKPDTNYWSALIIHREQKYQCCKTISLFFRKSFHFILRKPVGMYEGVMNVLVTPFQSKFFQIIRGAHGVVCASSGSEG